MARDPLGTVASAAQMYDMATNPQSGFVNTAPLIRTNPRNVANFCVAVIHQLDFSQSLSRGGQEGVLHTMSYWIFAYSALACW